MVVLPKMCPLFPGEVIHYLQSLLQRKNDMFQTHVSQSHSTSLDEVVVRLKRHHEVESLAILGSGATGILTPASDYDLLVVLIEMPVPISLILTTIDHRLAEVVLVSASSID